MTRKDLLLQIAAELTTATVGDNTPAEGLPVDPDDTTAALHAESRQTAVTHAKFYRYLVNNYDNEALYPTPKDNAALPFGLDKLPIAEILTLIKPLLAKNPL
jgi:hypothetical protein